MAKRLVLLAYVGLCVGGLNAVLYDCASGKPANETQLKIYEERNNTGICTVDVKPCDPKEWKRIDGSCNNLKWPSRGTHRTPTIRVLQPDFSSNYEPRKAADGGELPLSRRIRTEMLRTGKATDLGVTQLAAYYLVFSVGDINSIHDIENYFINISTCCKPEGRNDDRCTPVTVPVDDPVHRFSGINCMNLTKPLSFQTYGCLENGTQFVRMVFQTPVYDLSNTYNLSPGFNERLRTYKNGLMKMEEENGLLFPPSDPDSTLCFMNEPPKEKRCHKYHSNNVLGANLLNILFYRQHNKIAEELLELNPTWTDEQLFFTARDINIAVYLQIYLYELLPIFFGRSNMIRDGIITRDGGFRNIYDKDVQPQMTDEYVYVQRWFHTIQEGTLKLYDKDGYFLKTYPIVNATARTGHLAVDSNMAEVIQGSFRQPGAKFAYTIHPDMGDRVGGPQLLAADVAASDLAKGRFFGFPSYIKYKELFTKRSYKEFEDLKDHFHPERLYTIMQNYKSPSDLELMSGMWAEKLVKGGKVPEIMYSLFMEQLRRSIVSDRHSYERPNRPHAFNKAQLKAIRKATIAGMLCSVGNDVTEIQPRAFLTISSKNPLKRCSSSKIGMLDLSPWKEE